MMKPVNIPFALKALSVSAALFLGSGASATTLLTNAALGGTVTGEGSTSGTLSNLVDGGVRTYQNLAGVLAPGLSMDQIDLSTLDGFIGGAFQLKPESDPSIIKGVSTPVTQADGSKTFWVSVWEGKWTKAVKVRIYDDGVTGSVQYRVEKAGFTANQSDVGKNFDTIAHNNQTIAQNAGADGYGLAKLSVTAKADAGGQTYTTDPAFGGSTRVFTNTTTTGNNGFTVDFTASSFVTSLKLWQVTDCCQTTLGDIVVELYDGTKLIRTFTVAQSQFSATANNSSFASVDFVDARATSVRVRAADPTRTRLALTEVQVFAASAPGQLALLGLGLAGVGITTRRRKV